MPLKSLQLFGLTALVAASLHGQTYWSTTAPDCSSLMDGEQPVPITNSSGTVIGYSCWVSGTFIWLAAGGAWGSFVRVAAPASGAIGVDYWFYDMNGNNLSLDTSFGNSPAVTPGNEVNYALSANQPSQVNLLGLSGTNHSVTETGSVWAIFYCPDATTCGNVLPQLLYSALPTIPWSLSVPIAWDDALWTQWSAVGIDDGASHRVSLAVYNEDTTSTRPTSFTVQVYDSNGNLAGSGTTPPLNPIPVFSDGSYGEGGTWADLLSNVVKTPLPPGVFKVLIDGGSTLSAAEVLQITGASATTLQVAYDTSSSASASSAARKANARKTGITDTPKPVFKALPR